MALYPSDNNAERAANELRECQLDDDINRDQAPTDSGSDSDDSYSDSDGDIVLRPLRPGRSLVDRSGPVDDDVAIARGRVNHTTAAGAPPVNPGAAIEPAPAEPTRPRGHVNYPVVAAGDARRGDHVPHLFPGGLPAGPPDAPDAP